MATSPDSAIIMSMRTGKKFNHSCVAVFQARLRNRGGAILLFAAIFCQILLLPAKPACAASIMAVGQDEGYSGKVMDKVVAKWNPPPQLKGQYKLKLRIGVDGEGNVLECKATKGSGLQALDVSACAAVRAGAPYGSPPYGMPSDLYLSFWTGELPGQVRLSPASAERAPFVDTTALNMARDANERARAAAEAAAKSTGRSLDDLEKVKKKSPKMDKTRAAATSKKAEASGRTAPVAQSKAGKESPGLEKVAEESETADQATAAPGKTARELAGANEKADMPATPSKAKDPGLYENERYRKYISKISWELRKAMYVPKEAPPGTYIVTARVKCSKNGNILESSILEGSGNEYIDRYVLQGIKRAKRVPPPAPSFGDTFDLSFSLVRK